MLNQVLRVLLIITTLSILISCVSSQQQTAKVLAPSVDNYKGGVVQVYGARTHGAKQALAVHTWISVKKSNQNKYTTYEVIGWRLKYQDTALSTRFTKPDRDWWGHAPELLLDYRGDDVDKVIDQIIAAVEAYPYKDEYQVWPGPNSNTFTAFIGQQVPQLGLDLPSTAIGKDYRPIEQAIGLSSSGSGVQASLLGLLGVTVGVEEGLELNILGLSFELDLLDLAVELPGIGRIGSAPVQPQETEPQALD